MLLYSYFIYSDNNFVLNSRYVKMVCKTRYVQFMLVAIYRMEKIVLCLGNTDGMDVFLTSTHVVKLAADVGVLPWFFFCVSEPWGWNVMRARGPERKGGGCSDQ